MRGFTLVEVLVAAALSLLLTGVLAALMVLGFRTWRHSDARSQAQEQTLMVLAMITSRVRHANPDSLTLVPHPGMDGLTCLTGMGGNGATVLDPASGDVIWQQRCAIYGHVATQRVFLQQTPLQPPTSEPDPSTLVVSTITPQAGDAAVAHNVTKLALSLQNGVVNAQVQAVVDNVTCTEETTVSLLSPPAAASPSP